jgi:hypothetical protein
METRFSLGADGRAETITQPVHRGRPAYYARRSPITVGGRLAARCGLPVRLDLDEGHLLAFGLPQHADEHPPVTSDPLVQGARPLCR